MISLIQAGLADARIHQLDSTVTLSRSTHRVFGQEQWKFLQERLSDWTSSLTSVLSLITQTREKMEAQPVQQEEEVQEGGEVKAPESAEATSASEPVSTA